MWASNYSKDQWDETRKAYETTNLSVRKIAELTGIKAQAIESQIRRSDWTRPKQLKEAQILKKAHSKIARRVESKVQRKANELTERATEFKMQAIEQSFDTLQVVRELTEKLRNQDLDVETHADCLQKLTSSHLQLTNAAWKQFGLDQQASTIKIGLFLPVSTVQDTPAIDVQDVQDVQEVQDLALNGNDETPDA